MTWLGFWKQSWLSRNRFLDKAQGGKAGQASDQRSALPGREGEQAD